MMFLSPEDLHDLTGYKKPKLQRRWLTENGYRFDVRADGKPVVSRAHYESRNDLGTRRRPSAFNLAALDDIK